MKFAVLVTASISIFAAGCTSDPEPVPTSVMDVGGNAAEYAPVAPELEPSGPSGRPLAPAGSAATPFRRTAAIEPGARAEPKSGAHRDLTGPTADEASDAIGNAAIASSGSQHMTSENGSRVYVVQKGDTLSSIARVQFGDSKKWKRLATANPEINANSLKVGQKLKIPD